MLRCGAVQWVPYCPRWEVWRSSTRGLYPVLQKSRELFSHLERKRDFRTVFVFFFFFFYCLLFLHCFFFFFFPFPLKPLESLEFVFVTAAACRGLNRSVGSAAPLAGNLQLAPAFSPAESLTLCTWDAEGSAAPLWSGIISPKVCLFPSLCPSTVCADAWIPWQEQGKRGRSELGAPHPRSRRTTGFVRRRLVNFQRNSTNRNAVMMSEGLG